MNECKELQALGAITSEVDESYVKVVFSNQCLKAQLFLEKKLRKESERLQELCKRESSDNLKIEAEIKHAELELKSMNASLETLRSANIELKKELLLAKDRKQQTLQRVKDGEKKYDSLWNECKQRIESIPFVQKFFAASNRNNELKARIQKLGHEAIELDDAIRSKSSLIEKLDKERVIALAQYMVVERPKIIKAIEEKKALAAKLTKELEVKLKQKDATNIKATPVKSPKQTNTMILADDDWPMLREPFNNDEQDDLMMPKLNFANDDLNLFRASLDQMKNLSTPDTRSDEIKLNYVDSNVKLNNVANDYTYEEKISVSLSMTYLTNNNIERSSEQDGKSFKRKRLINILEDIAVTENEAQEMVSIANPYEMRPADAIGEKVQLTAAPMQDDQTEKMDVIFDSQDVLLPPTPFLDSSKTSQKSKDEGIQDCPTSFEKKRVSFELPVIQEEEENAAADEEIAEKANSQLNLSTASNESYNNMKETMLKKLNLDLSPDFVYAKKPTKLDDKIVTSKYFKNDETSALENMKPENDNKYDIEEIEMNQINSVEANVIEAAMDEDDVEEVIDSSAKNEAISDQKQGKASSGFLFTHGHNGLPESLDDSMNTTGFEYGEGDFPHGIDSSLLLSPKADMPGTSDNEAYSQEVPNFLSGLKKTGFSYFGGSSGPDGNSQQGGSQDGNFNFNFGGDDKKSRGGIFNMFR